jgi:hypothetical protein
MPLWVLALGGAAVAWWLYTKTQGLKYTINNPTAYYPTDPTASSVASAGALPTGSIVYATGPVPVTSSDKSFEQVISQNGTVWVIVSALTPA